MSTISGILSRTRYSSTRAIRRRKRSVAKCAFSESSDEAGTPYCGGIAEHVETGRVRLVSPLFFFCCVFIYHYSLFAISSYNGTEFEPVGLFHLWFSDPGLL